MASLPGVDNDDFEVLEVLNYGSLPVNLTGMQLTDGVQFAFPPETLDPGEYAVVVKDLTAFRLRYGDAIRVLGQFQDGSLSNSDDHLELRDILGQPLKVNRYIDKEIPLDNVLDRIRTMMEISAGFVVLPGGTGTLSELAIVWEFVAKKMIDPRPIFIVGDFWKPVVETVAEARPKHGNHIYHVNSVEEVVTLVKEHASIEKQKK